MAENTSARRSLWRGTLRRIGRWAHSHHGRWSVLVPLIAALAGLLFTTTAHTAAGTNLRDDRRLELSRLIAERNRQINTETAEATRLADEINDRTRDQARSDSRIREQQIRVDDTLLAAGFTGLRGPGVTVVLNDAPRRPDGSLPTGARPDDVIVHQQDVQSVVNALWAGGAEAMTIEGIRVISTSAVRCVGNTLLLHGQVFSPPFDIAAIGDPNTMMAALDADTGVQSFRDAAQAWGLEFVAHRQSQVIAEPYPGSVALTFATPAA